MPSTDEEDFLSLRDGSSARPADRLRTRASGSCADQLARRGRRPFTGGAYAGKKVVGTCLRHPIICGAVAAAGVVAAKKLNRDRSADIAAARDNEASGQPLAPPGFCPDETHSWLTAAVNNLCKDGNLNRCVEADTKLSLRAKAIAFSACAKARAKREEMCYRGGDPGHRRQIQQMWQAHDRCQTLAGLK
jgi:hypothetical protein